MNLVIQHLYTYICFFDYHYCQVSVQFKPQNNKHYYKKKKKCNNYFLI